MQVPLQAGPPAPQVPWEEKKQKQKRPWGLVLGWFQDGSSHEKSTFVATSRAAFVVVSSSFVLGADTKSPGTKNK